MSDETSKREWPIHRRAFGVAARAAAVGLVLFLPILWINRPLSSGGILTGSSTKSSTPEGDETSGALFF